MTSRTGILAAAGGLVAAALVAGLLALWSGGDPAKGLSPARDAALGGRPFTTLGPR